MFDNLDAKVNHLSNKVNRLERILQAQFKLYEQLEDKLNCIINYLGHHRSPSPLAPSSPITALPSDQDDADKVMTELGPPLIIQGHATDEGQRHDSAYLCISVASASAPLVLANSSGIILIPPTPQTSQEEKVYMISPLLPPSQIEKQRPQMDYADVAERNIANDQLIAKEL